LKKTPKQTLRQKKETKKKDNFFKKMTIQNNHTCEIFKSLGPLPLSISSWFTKPKPTNDEPFLPPPPRIIPTLPESVLLVFSIFN
jgi:hypothetical protein